MSPEDSTAVHDRLDRLETTLSTSLGELTSAVKALVILETEHKATRETLARYGTKIDSHDARLEAIERKVPYWDLLVKVGGRIGWVALSLITAGILGLVFIGG